MPYVLRSVYIFMTDLNSSVLKAKSNLVVMFIALTVLDSTLVVASKDLWAIGRIIITIAVMYYVLQGRKWAKWVLIGIFSLVVVLLTALIIALYSKLSTFLIFGSLILIIMMTVTGIFIISSQNLNRYFSAKRQSFI